MMGAFNQISVEYWRALREMGNPRAGKLYHRIGDRWYCTYHLLS